MAEAAHLAHLAHFARAPKLQSFKLEGKIKNRGDIWVNGRHNRAVGFNADLEKYLAAGLAGWRVFRFGPDQITLENVERMAEQVRDEIRQFSTESTWVKNQQIVDSESLEAKQAVKKVES